MAQSESSKSSGSSSVHVKRSIVKSLLAPARRALGRFVQPSYITEDQHRRLEERVNRDSIIFKAATLVATELVEGDYIEFGVYQGASTIRAFHALREVCNERTVDATHELGHRAGVSTMWNRIRFFAFDSFEGLPVPVGVDAETSDFTAGKFACDEETVLRRLKRSRVDLDKVICVPGWFDRTCNEETRRTHNMQNAAIVHIDCDLYESSITALRFVAPMLVDGSIIIFDDWYAYRGRPDRGEQRAFNEFRAMMPQWNFSQYQKEGPWRNSFIANLRG